MPDEPRPPDTIQRPGGVTIGNVIGGIHSSIIAGGNVNIQVVQQTRAQQDAINPAIPRLPQPYYSRRYPLPANFTGRHTERQLLTDWLTRDRQHILALVAMGGMGKSSLAWYWMHNDLDTTSLDGMLWWSFEEGEAAFARFLAEAISYVSNQTVNPASLTSAYDQVRTLVNLLGSRRILIVLDGFERQLQAYASMSAAYRTEGVAVSIVDARASLDPHVAQLLTDLAAGPTQAKVLLTTRLMIRDLESPSGEPLLGCRKEELVSLPPVDAVAFMRGQGIKGTDTEINAACHPYGYHPLSLHLLSGLIKRDKGQPGDIAVASRYQTHASLAECRNQVLATAYNDLPEPSRRLLSHLAAFRGAMPFKAMLIFNEFDAQDSFEQALDELIERGLLFFDATQGLFDLHPIVRAYAYSRLIDPGGTHARLRDYFAAIPMPDEAQIHTVQDLSPVIELYHHTVKAGYFDEAWRLYYNHLRKPLYYEICAYEVDAQLLVSLLDADQFPLVQGAMSQTWALIYLSMTYERIGQLRPALACAERAVALNREKGTASDLGSSLVALASVQSSLGLLRAAREANAEAVAIFDKIADLNWYGISHREYGYILILCGDLTEAERQLDMAQEIYFLRPTQFTHGLINVNMLRSDLLAARQDEAAALDMVQKVYETALTERFYREATNALYRLGRLQCAAGQLQEAKTSLETALHDCRRMRLVELEADVLLALARIHLSQSSSDPSHTIEMERYIDKALSITERHEYRLKQADIHNLIAQSNLKAVNLAVACQHAEKARSLAWCDGPPNANQSTLDEADKLLDEIAKLQYRG